ncbi:hypothetical protein R6Q59_009822 [Mikania micrantha]
MGQKRQRLALSCVDCRRRKVKCDRTYPICIRCQKGGSADSCLYVSHTGLEPDHNPPSDDSPHPNHVPPAQVVGSGEPYVLAALREMSPHMEVQARQPPPPTSEPPQQDPHTGIMHTLFGRAAQLETYTRSAGSRPVPTGLFTEPENVGVGPTDAVNPVSDASKVLFRGKNFSMLNQIPCLEGVKEKMGKTRSAAKKLKRQPQSKDPDLKSMIPDRSAVDKLVEKYLATFETTYRMLHLPSFLRSYQQYWQDPTSAKDEFLVILLLVMACTYCIVPSGPAGFVGRSSAGRETASIWIAACESWLEEQSQKHIRLPHLQAHTLVFISRAMNCIKIKREWTASGQLLRFAMAIGMHREPGLLSKRISVFDQEMRRRLWYTIVELDLLTTISRGMPPTIDSFSWDCLPPRNIDDEDFDETSDELPQPKSRTTYTRSSFLHLATESLPLRVEVLGRINSVRLGLDLDAVMQYDNRLRVILDTLPQWKDSDSASFARDLSRLVLYESILVLHIPFASQTQNKAKTFYSIASKRDISLKTLKLYAGMPHLERLTLTDIRDDACRAVLALSHDMTTHIDSDILPNLDQALSYMDTVVETLALRFHVLGQGFHSFWITLSAYKFLKWKCSPSEPAEKFAQEAADRVADVFQYILSSQAPAPLVDGETPANDSFTQAMTPSMTNSLDVYETAFPGFDQINFFGDPFSDMNFDMSMWNPDGQFPNDLYNI